MKISLKTRALSAAIVIPAALVVIVVAVLQYRWSNEVVEATGVRLADTLQLSMINWHLDFLRNFSEIGVSFRVNPEHEVSELDQYVRPFAEWKLVARYPDLISDVYVLKSDESATLSALRLDMSNRRFQSAEWPSALGPLRHELRLASAQDVQTPANANEARQFAESFYNISDALRQWRFEPTVPALLHPIPQRTLVRTGAPSSHVALDWLVIVLNDAVIQTKILPDLAHRYFSGTDGLDYQVAVVAGSRPPQVIYSSDSGFGQQPVADADGTMDVFGRVPDKRIGSPIYVFHTTSENRGPAARAGISWFPLLRAMPEDQDWQLIVRHRRGGPLGAFVADMHRRDLAISFGALLLLVVSMGMLIVSANRAQRLAKLQMDFVTAVTHELRTPLTVISSAADNITQGVVEGKQQLIQYGSVIGKQVRQLSGLVEQILLFAATNEGHQPFTLQPLQVAEIIDATLASTDGLISAARFTVERDIEPDLPPVMGDLLALSQCLENIITNALKYGREQRWIGIRARTAEHSAGTKEIHVSISDRGIGIGPQDLPHIFEPFYRSRSVAAAQIRGTGLGLSLARRIAEAMKGRLTVTSEPGRGSTFTLHLPCSEQPAQEITVEPSAAAASRSPHLRDC